jgi:hypothetical protein
VAGCCECSDKPSGSCAKELVSSYVSLAEDSGELGKVTEKSTLRFDCESSNKRY